MFYRRVALFPQYANGKRSLKFASVCGLRSWVMSSFQSRERYTNEEVQVQVQVPATLLIIGRAN
jgi:hypothetical protein